MRIIWIAGFIGILSPTTAIAQSESEVELLRQCSQIENIERRHDCYDQVLRPQGNSGGQDLPVTAPTPVERIDTDRAGSSRETGPVAKAERPAAPAAPLTSETDSFGLKATKPKEPDAVQVLVTRVGRTPRGKAVFYTDDGQVWVQTDKQSLFEHDLPTEVSIRKGTLGSFFLKAWNRTLRVKRQR